MSKSASQKPVWQNEDWMACFIGWFILLLAIWGVLPQAPKIAKWTSMGAAFPQGADTLMTTLIFFITIGVLTFIGGIFLKFDLRKYLAGLLVIFVLSFIALIIAGQKKYPLLGHRICALGADIWPDNQQPISGTQISSGSRPDGILY